MPITNVGLPITVVGPGVQMTFGSSLIGPFPIDWRWRVRIGRRGDEVNGGVFIDAPLSTADQRQREIQVDSITEPTVVTHRSVQYALATNEPVDITVELTDNAGLVVQDSGTISTAVWDSQVSTALLVQPAVAGSFTAQDRATAEETNQLSLAIQAATQVVMTVNGQPLTTTIGKIFTPNLLDRLTTQDISGGVTCEPIRFDASGEFLYGVQLIVEQFPEDWRFGTPDHGWGFHDLATLEFSRGGVTLKRLGIHTLLTTEYPLPGTPLPWIAEFPGIPIQPPDYHINVDWAEGVCGRLVGLAFP